MINVTDDLQDVLTHLEVAAADNVARGNEIRRRVAWFREQIDQGTSIADAVAAEDQPRLVELITANMTTLDTVGSEFRVELALALRDEGLTIEAVADLFGVTRQRISALLRQRASRDQRPTT